MEKQKLEMKKAEAEKKEKSRNLSKLRVFFKICIKCLPKYFYNSFFTRNQFLRLLLSIRGVYSCLQLRRKSKNPPAEKARAHRRKVWLSEPISASGLRPAEIL